MSFARTAAPVSDTSNGEKVAQFRWSWTASRTCRDPGSVLTSVAVPEFLFESSRTSDLKVRGQRENGGLECLCL